MADEVLRFDIIGKDSASGAFSRVGGSVKDMSANMNIATRSALVLDEALKRQQTAARASADATLATARADKILADAEHVLTKGALEAEFALKKETEAKKASGRAALKAAAENRTFADSLQKSADKAKKGWGPAWLGPALLAAPLATSIGGVTAGAAIGLSGAFVAAAGALAAFGAVAKPVLSQALTASQKVNTAQNTYQATLAAGVPTAQAQATLQGANARAQLTYNAALAGGANPAKALAAYHLALAKNQSTYNTATNVGTYNAKAYRAQQLAIGKAYADMSPQQIALSKQLGAMAQAWQHLKAAQTPVVAGALQPWLKSVTDLTKTLGPVIASVAPVIKDLGTQFDILMTSSAFQGFTKWIGSAGSMVTKSAGGAIISVVTGLTFLLPQFTPLIAAASREISKWGDAFVRWSASQKAANQIQGFLNWFHQNGPVVGGLLKNIGGALKALAPGVGPAATTEVQLFSNFFAFIAKLPPALAKPLLDTAAVLLTLNKLGVVSVGMKMAFPPKGAGKGALAASLGVKLLAGAFIVPVTAMIVGSLVPKDMSRQAQADMKKQPGVILRIDNFLHVTGMAEWVDHYLSHPVRAWAENSLPHFLGVARHDIATTFDTIRHDIASKFVDFFTKMVPAGLALFRDKAHLIWDQVSLDVLKLVFRITGYMGRLPGPLGAPFRAAHKDIGKELGGIQADAARTAKQINADWDRLHGKTVTLGFALKLPLGVTDPNPLLHPRGFAAGTPGAAPGWAWVGERGPELVHMRGGETVIANHQIGGYAGGTVGTFRGSFPSAAAIHGAAAGMQNAIGRIGGVVQGQLKVDPSMFGTGRGGMGDSGIHSGSAAAAQAYARSIMPMYGWGPEQWPPWLYLGNQESGWNAYAVNPSSEAYGIGQSLGHGHPYNLGDYINQDIWMANYIRGRYGNPAGAWAHEMAFNWYDNGGYLPPGASIAFNGTGRPEPVGAAAGGMNVTIHVHAPVGSSPAEIGRTIAGHLAEFKKRGGVVYKPGGF